MKRRGQIFLIMTILVLSFMIGITSVLLDIQKADFVDPAPDSGTTLRTWDITVKSLEQILDIQLAQDPTSGAKDISVPIANLESYLTGRVANSISITSPATVTINPTGTDVFDIQITATFNVYLSSNSVEINQQIQITINYIMTLTSTTVELTKTVNGILSYVQGATFSDTDATPGNDVILDNGNGSYNHLVGIGSSITAFCPSTLALTAQVP